MTSYVIISLLSVSMRWLRFVAATMLLLVNIGLLGLIAHVLFLFRWAARCVPSHVKALMGIEKLIDTVVYVHAKNIRTILAYVCQVRVEKIMQVAICHQKNYVLMSNHISWADTLLLLAYLADDLPHIRFFQKQSLSWLPLIGTTCLGLGHPFVVRPKLQASRRENINMLAKQREHLYEKCLQVFYKPSALAVFAEGTRYDRSKQGKNGFSNVGSPQSMGVAIALKAAQKRRKSSLLDVTIVYPYQSNHTLLEVLCGNMQDIRLDVVEKNDYPIQDYVGCRTERKAFHAWLSTIWKQKDAKIAAIWDRIVTD